MTDERLHEVLETGTCSPTEAVEMAHEVLSRRRADQHALKLMLETDMWANILDDLTDGSMRRALDREEPLTERPPCPASS